MNADHTDLAMPRITVITPYFPTSTMPNGGRSTYETLKELRQFADIHVICPLVTYPRWEFLELRRFLYRPPALDYSPPLIHTQYVQYPALPFVTRPANGLPVRPESRPRGGQPSGPYSQLLALSRGICCCKDRAAVGRAFGGGSDRVGYPSHRGSRYSMVYNSNLAPGQRSAQRESRVASSHYSTWALRPLKCTRF